MRGKRARSAIGLTSRRISTRQTYRSGFELLERRQLLFSPGNIVVERAGDGSPISATAQPLVLQEYTTSANQVSPVSSVGLPASTTGSNNQGWVTDGATSI